MITGGGDGGGDPYHFWEYYYWEYLAPVPVSGGGASQPDEPDFHDPVSHPFLFGAIEVDISVDKAVDEKDVDDIVRKLAGILDRIEAARSGNELTLEDEERLLRVRGFKLVKNYGGQASINPKTGVITIDADLLKDRSEGFLIFLIGHEIWHLEQYTYGGPSDFDERQHEADVEGLKFAKRVGISDEAIDEIKDWKREFRDPPYEEFPDGL